MRHPDEPPVTVAVHPNGQVWVNSVLVAEVVVGRDGPGTGVVTRDDLAHQLKLHRIADTVAEHLGELVRHAETMDPGDRADFGVALLAALAGERGEATGRQPYRAGHRAGVTLRSMHSHLAAAIEASR